MEPWKETLLAAHVAGNLEIQRNSGVWAKTDPKDLLLFNLPRSQYRIAKTPAQTNPCGEIFLSVQDPGNWKNDMLAAFNDGELEVLIGGEWGEFSGSALPDFSMGQAKYRRKPKEVKQEASDPAVENWRADMLAAFKDGELEVRNNGVWMPWKDLVDCGAPDFSLGHAKYRRRPKPTTPEEATSDDKWGPWVECPPSSSSVCPVPLAEAGQVEVRLRNGNISGNRRAENYWWGNSIEHFNTNIIAYRVLKELVQPAADKAADEEDDWGPWVEWMGGEVCPIPNRKHGEFRVKLLGGAIIGGGTSDLYRWNRDHSSGDIVAYQVKKKFMPQAETKPTRHPSVQKQIDRQAAEREAQIHNAAMIKRDGDPLPPPPKPTPAPAFMTKEFKMPAPVGLLVERHPADRYRM